MFVRKYGMDSGVLQNVFWTQSRWPKMQVVRKGGMMMTNLLERVATQIDGVKNLTTWLGSGGVCVDQEVAQERADICNYGGPERRPCPKNVTGSSINDAVAEATKRFLEFKNDLELKVKGEKQLKSCDTCGCVLRLMVWETQDRIAKQMTPEEVKESPEYCWKLRKV